MSIRSGGWYPNIDPGDSFEDVPDWAISDEPLPKQEGDDDSPAQSAQSPTTVAEDPLQ